MLIKGVTPEVPLVEPAISPGDYNLLVTDVAVEENKKKNGFNLVLNLKVLSAGGTGNEDIPDKGRTIRNWTPVSQVTAIKRIFISAGQGHLIDGSDLDPANLKDKILRATVKQHAYTEDNQQKMGANIKDFILPEGTV